MIDPETGEAFTCGIGRESCESCEERGRCQAEVGMAISECKPGDVLPKPHAAGERWTVVSIDAGDYSRVVNSDGSVTEHHRTGSATMRHADGTTTVNRFNCYMNYSINLVAILKKERDQRERWAADERERQEKLLNRLCAVGWCDEKVGVADAYVNYCPAHSDEESSYETEQVVRLRDELDKLQGSILNLAGVALAPYVRALVALDDSRRILGVAQDANGERYDELPDLLERITIYEGAVEIEGRGEVLDEDWAPARARVRESFVGVKQRLRELKRLRRKVAKQALGAGLETRIQAAIVYAGVDEGERA